MLLHAIRLLLLLQILITTISITINHSIAHLVIILFINFNVSYMLIVKTENTKIGGYLNINLGNI